MKAEMFSKLLTPWSIKYSPKCHLWQKCVLHKLAKSRETSATLVIFIKCFEKIFWRKFWQIRFVFHLIITFWFGWLGCFVQKMNAQFQHPLYPISIIHSKLVTNSVSFHQKKKQINWEVLMKIEEIKALSISSGHWWRNLVAE